ncbi:MAG TPA: hypothetical protein P5268_02470 [Candidatus Marinimicrobia bacterium]|nr:hypothetical protein [Candidatus Neomarinimicrobiota bacterium]HRS51989.1 hypothetical protein [Candidatus Neomarinimicrobiota bacterium]HRU91882.1 hypothetical protein [Candidatus Neomarinimicrobiota bacterium]
MKAKIFYVFIVLALSLSTCGTSRPKPEKTVEKTTKAQSGEAKKPAIKPGSQSTLPASQPKIATAPVKATAADQEYVINELTFEVKKLSAEVKHLQSALKELQAKSQMWDNPLSIYEKEIILINGTSIYGKIIYQDDKIIKVETLIGYLVIDKNQVVRVVTNIVEKREEQFVPQEVATDVKDTAPITIQAPYISKTSEPSQISEPISRVPNCVLVGNIKERKDLSGNTILSGEIKNIGGRRADFVKINFVFRKNWSGDTETRTAFVEGSYVTFEGSGITSNNSLLPGASGTFEMIIPKDFGQFIGYSYNIDWEVYK